MHSTAKGSELAPLGTITNNRAKPPPEALQRLEKYVLQSAARKVLPRQRVAMCLRVPRPGVSAVAVHHSPTEKRASYRNLCLCGNVWQCAVCSGTISNARRIELGEALRLWQPRGSVYLATLTVQHHGRMPLRWLLSEMLASWSHLREGDSYKRLRRELRLRYVVRSLEVMWSQSDGWHPHFHVLFFVEGEKQRALSLVPTQGLPSDQADSGSGDEVADSLESRLHALWLRSLQKRGLTASRDRGVRVESAYGRVADYVAKFGHLPARETWGPQHEMTQWHRKHGRLAGDGDAHLSPFDLLRWLVDTGEQQPADLFRKYAGAFFSRKQLSWSPNMRKELGMGAELTDEELVEVVASDWDLLAMVELDDWRVIAGRELRGELLEVAAIGDAGLLGAWIQRAVW